MRHLFTSETNTVAISFQNGLGNEEQLAEYFGEDRVLGGLTAQGANIEGPGIVRNHAELPSYIGEMSGGISKRTKEIAAVLTANGLPTEASENIRQDIWRKLMANIAISAVSGITGLKIGQIFNQHLADDVSYAALDEAAYKGFVNPVLTPVMQDGKIVDVTVDPRNPLWSRCSTTLTIIRSCLPRTRAPLRHDRDLNFMISSWFSTWRRFELNFDMWEAAGWRTTHRIGKQ